MEEKKIPQLVMKLEKDFYTQGTYVLPAAFSMRHATPEDHTAWENIISQTFHFQSNFKSNMMNEACFSYKNVILLFHDDKAVATASAWKRSRWTDAFGEKTGYIHMVAVLEEYRGRHLGAVISRAAIEKSFENGNDRCILQTDDYRISALLTYVKIGFEPVIVDRNQYERWENVYKKIDTLYHGAIDLSDKLRKLEASVLIEC